MGGEARRQFGNEYSKSKSARLVRDVSLIDATLFSYGPQTFGILHKPPDELAGIIKAMDD